VCDVLIDKQETLIINSNDKTVVQLSDRLDPGR